MRIAITGGTGLLGTRLQQHLGDHEVHIARRSGDGLRWDPEKGLIDPAAWERFDAVIHLAGETIGQRWSPAVRSRIMTSRAAGTRNLVNGLIGLKAPPRVLISASAVGWYGDAGDRDCSEDAPHGEGFLADVVAAWEAAAAPAREAGMRVVHPRTGIVLGDGGALQRMLPPFKFGLGGPMGSGKQWFPWIHIDDWCRAIIHLLVAGSGPVNLVSPGLCRQGEFAKALGTVLRRPAFMPLPGFMVQLMFGEMGRQLLLWGQHAAPHRLEHAGFHFEYTDAEAALRDVLDRPAK